MVVQTGSGLIFPVGHYLGAFHPARGAPPQHYVVRVGWDTVKLPDESHLNIWFLAHGLVDRVDAAWTWRAIAETAHAAGMSDPDAIIARLLELRLLAVVHPGTSQAVEFALSYRVQPLLVGLGNSPDDPELDGIGLPGLPPLLKVPPASSEIWQWGHLWPSIWLAADGLAQVAREAGEWDPQMTEARPVLENMLVAVRTLVASNAIYLDVARDSGA